MAACVCVCAWAAPIIRLYVYNVCSHNFHSNIQKNKTKHKRPTSECSGKNFFGPFKRRQNSSRSARCTPRTVPFPFRVCLPPLSHGFLFALHAFSLFFTFHSRSADSEKFWPSRWGCPVFFRRAFSLRFLAAGREFARICENFPLFFSTCNGIVASKSLCFVFCYFLTNFQHTMFSVFTECKSVR